MKNQIILAMCCLSLGMLTMVHELCKQKDSMIRLLMKNTSSIEQQTVSMPENLQKIVIK